MIRNPCDSHAFTAILNRPNRFILKELTTRIDEAETMHGLTFQDTIRATPYSPARHEQSIHRLVDQLTQWRMLMPPPAEVIQEILARTEYVATARPGQSDDLPQVMA